VLTHVLAGRTRHRRCRTHGAALTRSATRPGLAAAVGASTRLVAQAFFPAIQLRPAGPRYPAAKPSSQPEHHPRPWPCWRMRAGRRGDRVELTIGPGSSEAVSPRPSHHLPVPSLVDRAAPSGVVPGEPGGAAVLGAGSGFAEGAHHRSGAGGAASAIAHRHSHACIVPPPKQGKRCSASPYPAGRGRCGRIGSVAACRVLLWCGAGCGGWAGLAGRGPKGSAPPGQVAGCRVPHEPARSAAVDPARVVAWP
jgi:hypothetical protein